VLDDGTGGTVRPRRHRRRRRLDVEQVVEGQFLPLQLAEVPDAPGFLGGVERRLLVGVLAIPEDHQALDRKVDPGGQPVFGRRQVPGDGGIVVRRVAEHLGRHLPAAFRRNAAGAEHLEHRVVVLGVDHGEDELEVLRRRPEHRGPAHVDVFDGVLEADVGIGDGRLERVQIHRHQVEPVDLQLRHGPRVGREIPAGQQAGMDSGVKGLHPAVENLRESGHLVHRRHRQPGFLEAGRRAAGGHQLPPQLHQAPGESDDTALVADGNQGARHGNSITAHSPHSR
jgi:hypothetical protein